MKKTIDKGSEEWKIFQRIFKFYQDYAIPEDIDEYWKTILAEMKSIETEYDDNPLAVYLALGVAKALNDISTGFQYHYEFTVKKVKSEKVR